METLIISAHSLHEFAMGLVQVRTLLESVLVKSSERVQFVWWKAKSEKIYTCVYTSAQKDLPKTFRRVRNDLTSSLYTGYKSP